MATASNWCRCTSCHIGFGWDSKDYDFTVQQNVDCLVCHDGTGTYKKFPTDCGHPTYVEKSFGSLEYEKVDLGYVARNVAKSSRKTCGECHFYGGGGDGVKHGDLDSSLFLPNKDLDVHMDADGLNYQCTACHTASVHEIIGRNYSKAAPNSHRLALPNDDGIRIGCANCHSNQPHTGNQKLNDHTDKVACQTCHIPRFARGGVSTQLDWDWSTAGARSDSGDLVVRKDSQGNVIYHSKKGTMSWGTDIIPEYAWYNGLMSYLQQEDVINPNSVVVLTRPHGSPEEKNALIFPFKIHLGKQPYDPERNQLVVPKLYGKKGSKAYWAVFDWIKAAEAGMQEYGAPFSGKIGFVSTKYYSPLSHMIAPKEDALKCGDCHSRNGRLASLQGFYLPGRDKSDLLDVLGWSGVLLAVAGILIHGLMRFAVNRK